MNNERLLKPDIVNIELTNACNLECVFCDWPALRKNMKIGAIDTSLLEKIVSEAASFKPYEIGVVGLGDPLLDPHLSDHLAIINNYKSAFERISLNTNGVVLTPEKTDLICDSCINHVTFSLNATNKSMYEHYMKYDYFDKVIGNIRSFVRQRNRKRKETLAINVQAMGVRQEDLEELQILFKKEIDDGVYVFLREIYNKPALRDAHIDQEKREIGAKRYPCWSLYSRIYIDVAGNLYPCTIGNDCYRENSDLCIGSIREKNIMQLFNDVHLVERRDRSCRGELPFKECDICNVWTLLPNNFVWSESQNKWVCHNDETRLDSLDVPQVRENINE